MPGAAVDAELAGCPAHSPQDGGRYDRNSSRTRVLAAVVSLVDCHPSGEPVSVADLKAEADRWPRFVPAALDAGFASVHAVPMRAAGIVLGALGLFGVRPGSLNDADLLVGQTLAHIASVAILQEHAPTPSTVVPQLRSALTSRVHVEQAKGFLRESLDVSVEQAFKLLRSYARANGEHLTHVARRLMTDRQARPALLAAISEFATASTT